MSGEEKNESDKKAIMNESEMKDLCKQSIEGLDMDEKLKEKIVKRFTELLNHKIH
jgi:hypothetical protein